VVIDTFRAFSTAAYLVDRGVVQIVLAETLDEARERAATIPGSLLCGEEGGRRPDDFDLGNSPIEVGTYPDLAHRTIVMRTSAGTRTIVRALRSGADPVYAASLVVAGSTASAVRRSPRVTFIASGLGGVSIADEDEETAGLISDRILGRPDDAMRIGRIRRGAGATRLRSTPWIDPEDLTLCLRVDRFSFALRARLNKGVATLHAAHGTGSDSSPQK
jgi:2-phosphosulfolactate phosphatase